MHSCAIQAGTGDAICWGSDGHGQATPPASVDGTSGTASAISAGGEHSLAIQTVPEPSSVLQLITGGALLAALQRRRPRHGGSPRDLT